MLKWSEFRLLWPFKCVAGSIWMLKLKTNYTCQVLKWHKYFQQVVAIVFPYLTIRPPLRNTVSIFYTSAVILLSSWIRARISIKFCIRQITGRYRKSSIWYYKNITESYCDHSIHRPVSYRNTILQRRHDGFHILVKLDSLALKCTQSFYGCYVNVYGALLSQS